MKFVHQGKLSFINYFETTWVRHLVIWLRGNKTHIISAVKCKTQKEIIQKWIQIIWESEKHTVRLICITALRFERFEMILFRIWNFFYGLHVIALLCEEKVAYYVLADWIHLELLLTQSHSNISSQGLILCRFDLTYLLQFYKLTPRNEARGI